MTQAVKNQSATQENWVHSLGQEDPWKREWLPSLVFLLENSRDRGAWHAAVHGVAKESDTTEQITFLLFFTVIINVLIFYCRNGSGILVTVFVSQDLLVYSACP